MLLRLRDACFRVALPLAKASEDLPIDNALFPLRIQYTYIQGGIWTNAWNWEAVTASRRTYRLRKRIITSTTRTCGGTTSGWRSMQPSVAPRSAGPPAGAAPRGTVSFWPPFVSMSVWKGEQAWTLFYRSRLESTEHFNRLRLKVFASDKNNCLCRFCLFSYCENVLSLSNYQ